MAVSNGATALHLVSHLLIALERRDPGLLAEIEASIHEVADAMDGEASIQDVVPIIEALARAVQSAQPD